MEHHLEHALLHARASLDGIDPDPDSGMPQDVHIACRRLMALEVYLGGGK